MDFHDFYLKYNILFFQLIIYILKYGYIYIAFANIDNSLKEKCKPFVNCQCPRKDR